MPRDAFGNEINDDPLAGLSSYGPGSNPSSPGPSPSPPGVPGGPKRRGGGTLAAIIAVLILAGAGLGGLVYMSGGEDDASDAKPAAAETVVAETPAAPDPETPAAPDPEPAAAAPTEAPKPPAGLQPGSLLRRANFIVGLRRLREKAGGKPRNVRVEAQRIDIQLILNDGRMRNAQASWDGEVRIFSTTATPIAGLKGYAWSKIDRSAPQRMVRSATGRARKPASAFNYAVLLDPDSIGWSAFLKSGEAFNADASGHIRRQIS